VLLLRNNTEDVADLMDSHHVGDILGVRSKAEWTENGTLGNAACSAVDREAGRLAARVSTDLNRTVR